MKFPVPLPADTSLDAYRVQTEVVRRMTPAERLRIAFELGDGLRAWSAAGVRSRHPEYSDEQVRLATIRLQLGDQLFREAFPDSCIAP